MTCHECKNNGINQLMAPVFDGEKGFVLHHWFCTNCLHEFEKDGFTEVKK